MCVLSVFLFLRSLENSIKHKYFSHISLPAMKHIKQQKSHKYMMKEEVDLEIQDMCVSNYRAFWKMRN